MTEDFQVAVLRELGDIKVLCEKGLAQHEVRITAIEKTNARQWWLHALSPLFLTATAFAKKAGLV